MSIHKRVIAIQKAFNIPKSSLSTLLCIPKTDVKAALEEPLYYSSHVSSKLDIFEDLYKNSKMPDLSSLSCVDRLRAINKIRVQLGHRPSKPKISIINRYEEGISSSKELAEFKKLFGSNTRSSSGYSHVKAGLRKIKPSQAFVPDLPFRGWWSITEKGKRA